jgi:hypothetical protein
LHGNVTLRKKKNGRSPLSSPHKATAAKPAKKEHSVANNKNPNQKQPGEKEPGTFHYNPGNMSGKTIGASKDESEQSNADGRREQQDKKAVDN